MTADESVARNYTFGGWTIRPEARELLTSHGPAVLEPRAFDLLVYLIENRHRIVSKDELLDAIWKTPHVSESVLARAVMKSRKALSDHGVEGEWIQTAHRIGYRFTGEPILEGQAEHVPSAPPANSVRRIALLPFENKTGDPILDWMELGLLTMTGRAVAATNLLAVDGVERVLGVLAVLSPDASFEEKIQQLRNALGVQSVIRTTIAAMADGRYRLTWSAWIAGNVIRRGELIGDQVAAFALELAAALTTELGGAQEKPPLGVALSSDEDFALAAHARASQAFAKEQYAFAVTLIRVCVDIEPHSLEIDVDSVVFTASVDANQAAALGQTLLGRIDPNSHPREFLRLIRALAESALRLHKFDQCEQYCDEAKRLLRLDTDYDTYRNFVFFRFVIAFSRGHANTAREIARSWVARARDRSDTLDLAGALGNLAMLELTMGDWEAGKLMAEEANSLSTQFKLWASVGANLANLAVAHAARGQHVESRRLNGQALQHVQSIAAGNKEVPILGNLYTDCWNLGLEEAAFQCISRLKTLLPVPSAWELSHYHHIVDAEMRFGDVVKAHHDARESAHRIIEVEGTHQALGGYLTALAANGDLREAHEIVSKVSEQYEVPSPSTAHANYLLGVAQMAYVSGDDRRAYGILERYVANLRGYLTSFKGGTDLMWLALELGRLEDAVAMSEELVVHLDQSLRGNATAARLFYEQNDFAEAAKRQRVVIKMASGRRLLPYLVQLLEHYEAASRGANLIALPRAPLLPSAF